MKSPALRSFSSAGKVSRGAVTLGLSLAVLSVVTAVVVARAGTADEKTAAIDAGRHVLAAAEAWQTENSEGCPTVTVLIESGGLDEGARLDDPWGNRYRIVCEGIRLSVLSAGPDKRMDTQDDVSIGRDDG